MLLMAVLLLATGGWAQAQATTDRASHEDVLKLMELMRCREMTKTVTDSMMSQMLPAMHQRMKQTQPNISDAELADFDKIIGDFMQQMPFDEMFKAMIPAYEKNLTAAEVKAMIDFYSSPTGQSVLAKMPAISADAMKEMQPILMKSMDNMDSYMQTKIKELQQKYHPEAAKPTS